MRSLLIVIYFYLLNYSMKTEDTANSLKSLGAVPLNTYY